MATIKRNDSLITKRPAPNSAVNASMMQQTGGTQGSELIASQELVEFVLEGDITLNSLVPPNSRMMSKIRTFRKGEKVLGKPLCDKGYITVEDGFTYRFPCNGILKPTETKASEGKTQVETSAVEPTFFQKNKTAIIVGSVLVAAGIGYYFWKKNK